MHNREGKKPSYRRKGAVFFIGVHFQEKVSELPAGPEPPFFTNLFNLMPAAAYDAKPENTSFGDVLDQVNSIYRQVGHLLRAEMFLKV